MQETRKKAFPKPFALVYQEFCNLGFPQCDSAFFMQNASDIVEVLRKNTWETFLPLERKFTADLLQQLVPRTKVNEMEPFAAIAWLFNEFPEHIYQLSLSNTQSRRSRARKEFEAIIELILCGANIPFDTQSAIGKMFLWKRNLEKWLILLLLVSPNI